MAAALSFVEAIASVIAECRTNAIVHNQVRQEHEVHGRSPAIDTENADPATFREKISGLQNNLEAEEKVSALQRKLTFVDSTLKQLRAEIETMQEVGREAEKYKAEKEEMVAEHSAHVQWLEKELEQSTQHVTEMSDKLWLQAEHEELIRQLQHQTTQTQELQQAMVDSAREQARGDVRGTCAENDIFRKHLGEEKANEILSAASSQSDNASDDRSVEAYSTETGVRTEIQALDRLLKQKDKELELEREKAKGIRSSIHQKQFENSSKIADLQTNLLSSQKGFAKYFELYKGVDEELKMARERHEVDSRCLGQLWAMNEKLKSDIAALDEKVWMEKRIREMTQDRVSELETLLGEGTEDVPNQAPFQHTEMAQRRDAEAAGQKESALAAASPRDESFALNGKKSPSPRVELAKTLAGYQDMLSSRDKQVVELQRQMKAISEARAAEQEAVVQHMRCEDDDKRQLRSELNHERILRSKAERDGLSLQFELHNLQQQLAVRHSIAAQNPQPHPHSPASASPAGGLSPAAPRAAPHPSSPVESLFSGLIGFLSRSPRSADAKHASPIPTATIASPRGAPPPATGASPSSPSKPRPPLNAGGVLVVPASPSRPPLETIAERECEASPRDDDASPSQSPRRDGPIKVYNDGSTGVSTGVGGDGGRQRDTVLFEVDFDNHPHPPQRRSPPSPAQRGGSGQVLVISRPLHSSVQRQANSDCRAAQAAGYGDPSSPEWRITL